MRKYMVLLVVPFLCGCPEPAAERSITFYGRQFEKYQNVTIKPSQIQSIRQDVYGKPGAADWKIIYKQGNAFVEVVVTASEADRISKLTR